ncbi:hypothetical protein D3C80_1251130 [compost metagenome]
MAQRAVIVGVQQPIFLQDKHAINVVILLNQLLERLFVGLNVVGDRVQPRCFLPQNIHNAVAGLRNARLCHGLGLVMA